jgi:antitoxin (DNA-binding transcriptional repressor) of toxin-antitoxin stability system
VPEVSATEASRSFADLLDAVEHRGERFTIVRRGRVVAELGPSPASSGAEAKTLLRRHRVDAHWAEELVALRSTVATEDRY